jgi:hypothetical protein
LLIAVLKAAGLPLPLLATPSTYLYCCFSSSHHDNTMHNNYIITANDNKKTGGPRYDGK